MWLLSTRRLELRNFARADEVPGGYAILSHVWQSPEQSFHDIQELCKDNASLTDPRLSAKIRKCIEVSVSYNIDWLWVDASCIDKSSSAELSEAINSMFSWYAGALICFAYLYDVPNSCAVDAPASAFRNSKWFTRGWTLQELIAPKCVVFMSMDWTYLGTKASIASLLTEITGIHVGVLTFRKELAQVSVACRMSWASKRETTRSEDEAYCLMGLFGITMPTIYGEGREAFRRLQEEILKRSPDQTLFAWGRLLPSGVPSTRLTRGMEDISSTLFATSPRDFRESADYKPVSRGNIRRTLEANMGTLHLVDVSEDPDFTVTNLDVQCQPLVMNIGHFVLAMLACQTSSGDTIALLLRQRNQPVDTERPQYSTGALCDTAEEAATFVTTAPQNAVRYRLFHVNTVSLSGFIGSPLDSARDTIRPQTMYIIHSLALSVPHPWLRLLEEEPRQIVLPPWLALQCKRYNFEQESDDPSVSTSASQCEVAVLPLTLWFHHEGRPSEAFAIHLERYQIWLCASVFIQQPSSHPHPIALVSPLGIPTPNVYFPLRAFEESTLGDGVHPSELQHCIRFWPQGSRTFGDGERNLTLSFTRWPTRNSYCLDLSLGGTAYDPQSSSNIPGRSEAILRKHFDGLVPRLPRRLRYENAASSMVAFVMGPANPSSSSPGSFHRFAVLPQPQESAQTAVVYPAPLPKTFRRRKPANNNSPPPKIGLDTR
ncbi:hypothetical protein C8Q77DRAFT_808688 [Trametes polyzona]|nr:hypothetical protein C8Q77DRAFT_808688 [Trametes polyzona]